MVRLGECCRLERRGTLRIESAGPMDLQRQKAMKVSPESQNDYTACIGRSGMESPSITEIVRKWNGRDPLACACFAAAANEGRPRTMAAKTVGGIFFRAAKRADLPGCFRRRSGSGGFTSPFPLPPISPLRLRFQTRKRGRPGKAAAQFI